MTDTELTSFLSFLLDLSLHVTTTDGSTPYLHVSPPGYDLGPDWTSTIWNGHKDACVDTERTDLALRELNAMARSFYKQLTGEDYFDPEDQ